MKTYIVDIDGTLAKIDHRLSYIGGDWKDWDAFFDLCSEDEPIQDVIDVVRCLAMSEAEWMFPKIIYLTGRPERIRSKTVDWLRKHHLPEGELIMRKDGDHRPDTTAKRELMDSIIAKGGRIAGVFEDRPSVVRVWREMGLTVFQMQDKEF